MIDLSLEEELGTRFHVPMTNDNEEQIGAMLNEDALLLGLSDAGAHTTQLCDADFATWLLQHWWREQRVISLEKAIWRLTAQPADFLGLEDRGRLRPGSIADIVVFHPDQVGTQPAERIHDQPAGADRLVARSTGIEHVFVAGTPTRSFGEDLPLVPQEAPGRLLRSSPPSSSH